MGTRSALTCLLPETAGLYEFIPDRREPFVRISVGRVEQSLFFPAYKEGIGLKAE